MRDPRNNPSFVDLTGQRFGRLTVESMGGVHPSKSRHRMWTCVCDCGERLDVAGIHLRHEHTKSCGCLQREKAGAVRRSHGKSNTPEFRTWAAMNARCRGGGKDAHLYRDKGIAVCERWRESFANFLADMGAKPSPAHSIDRVDGSKGYDPANCRWALPIVQGNNTTRNVLITDGGVTKTAAQWARERGIKRKTICQRIRHGVDPVVAITKESLR